MQSRDLQTVLQTCYSEYTILVIWTVKTKQSRAAASTYSWQKLKALLSNHEPISAREFYNQERAEVPHVPHVPLTGSCKGPRQRGLSRLLPGGTAVLGVCVARIQNSANDAHGDMVTCPMSPWSGWQLQLVLSCSGGRWGTRQAHSSLQVQEQSVALTSFGEQMVLSKIKHLKPVASYIEHPLGNKWFSQKSNAYSIHFQISSQLSVSLLL